MSKENEDPPAFNKDASAKMNLFSELGSPHSTNKTGHLLEQA